MSLAFAVCEEKSRLRALLDHFGVIEDPRDVPAGGASAAGSAVAGCMRTMADCDDFDAIAAWGEAHLPFLRHYLPYHNGVPVDAG